jgi:hypothetical protein
MTGPRSTLLPSAEEAVLRHDPHRHGPRVVLAHDRNGLQGLDQFADLISRIIGLSTFVIVTAGIVVWLFGPAGPALIRQASPTRFRRVNSTDVPAVARSLF